MVEKLISHYRILEKLGQGGMGVVYKAEDTKLKRLVALKFLPEHLTRHPEAKKRFMQEAQAAAALNHPHICTIYAIEEVEEKLFIAMEFIEGQSLSSAVGSHPLPVDNCLGIAFQIAEGLHAAHEKGIVHRDLSSNKVMINSRGRVKIMDFGLAQLLGSSRFTQMGTVMGTVAYMSPEQTRGKKIDHRTDIWSLGVALYEMLAGELPFRGDHPQVVIYSIINETPEPLASRRNDAPPELVAIVNKMLVKNPNERYQSTEEVLADLQPLVKERKISIKTESTFKSQSSPPQRLVWYAGIPVLVLALIAATLIFFKASSPAIDSLAVLPFVNSSTDQSVIWGEQYHRRLADILAIQTEITTEITAKMRLRLSHAERQHLQKQYTENSEAYRLYLLGQYHASQYTREGLDKGIGYFNQAIALDSSFALAYFGLAYYYVGITDWFVPAHEAMPKAKAAAEKAIALDETLAEAHAWLAVVHFWYEWNQPAALREFRRALELNHNYALARSYYGAFLVATGNFEAGIAEAKKAQELDPLSPETNSSLGVCLYAARRRM